MPSLFESILAVTDDVVDVINGELFSFFPMKGIVNARFVPDSTRSAIPSLIAKWDDKGEMLNSGAGLGSPDRDSSLPKLLVMDKYLPEGVKNGDQFIRTRTGIKYIVKHVDPDSLTSSLISVQEC